MDKKKLNQSLINRFVFRSTDSNLDYKIKALIKRLKVKSTDQKSDQPIDIYKVRSTDQKLNNHIKKLYQQIEL